jgi:hypothetical protein
MNNDYIKTFLKVTLDDGDTFTTSFNITHKLLKERSMQQIVDSYYVRNVYVCANETSRIIRKVDILSAELFIPIIEKEH